MAEITTFRTVTTKELSGYICDKCGKMEEYHVDDFKIRYHFGYGTKFDVHSIEADLCDDCLLELVINHVPNARIMDFDGHMLTTEEKLQLR